MCLNDLTQKYLYLNSYFKYFDFILHWLSIDILGQNNLFSKSVIIITFYYDDFLRIIYLWIFLPVGTVISH